MPMTFEEYLKKEIAEGKIDFRFRASNYDGTVRIYVHPDGKNGSTTPTGQVTENTLIWPEGWHIG